MIQKLLLIICIQYTPQNNEFAQLGMSKKTMHYLPFFVFTPYTDSPEIKKLYKIKVYLCHIKCFLNPSVMQKVAVPMSE